MQLKLFILPDKEGTDPHFVKLESVQMLIVGRMATDTGNFNIIALL